MTIDTQLDKFQVINPGGNTELSIFVKTLHNLPKFSIVKSLTIARDSEKNPQGASRSVQTCLEKGGFSVPPAPGKIASPAGSEHNVKVGYILFPKINAEGAGTLEDLCLNSLASSHKDKILEISDRVIESVSKSINELRRPHKNRLHTYLSLTNDFVGLKLGEAAKANAFNILTSEIETLKTFLSVMLE
jgi:hypothetical protein